MGILKYPAQTAFLKQNKHIIFYSVAKKPQANQTKKKIQSVLEFSQV